MDNLDCDVCFHQFNEENKQPRTLSCGHTLCTICITDGITSGQLTCPFCREVHSVSAATDIAINFTLQKVVRSFKVSGITPLETSKEKTLGLEPEIHAGICTGHGSYRLFWCSKCQIWICHICTVVDHPSSTCSVISIKQALKDVKDEELKLVKENEEVSNIHIICLNDYEESVKCCDEKYDEQIEELHGLIRKIKDVKIQLKKEKDRVNECVSSGFEAIKKMEKTKKKLADEETADRITAARHESRKSREGLESWKKFSEDELTKSDVLEMSEKFQKCVSVGVRVANMSDFSLPGVVASFIDYAEKVKKETTVAVEDLHYLCRVVPVWAVLADNSRAAPISHDENFLCLHALREAAPPENAFIFPYENVKSLIKSPPTVFMEFSWGGQKQGCVHMQMDNGDDVAKPFIERCSGVDANSFVNSKMVQVLGTQGQERLCGGGDGTINSVTEPPSRQSQHSKGWVTLTNLESTPGFAIWYKDLNRRTYNNHNSCIKLGSISRGIEVVENAAQQPDVKEVAITECGFLVTR